MYLWRKRTTPQWWNKNQDALWSRFGQALAVTERPDRKRVQIEVVCDSRDSVKGLGGSVAKLRSDWLERIFAQQKAKPLKIGKHLVIARSDGFQASTKNRQRSGDRRSLIIPAGAAFGTGDHATTAMSLRMLERVISCWGVHAPSRADCGASPQSSESAPPATKTELFGEGGERGTRRRVRSPELIVDLGTGSGILALAAKCLGAKRVIGIDLDPLAISTAKDNARRNKIRDVQFRVADLRRWKIPRRIDLVTANLFSELLIEILPKIAHANRLILSGVLRRQEPEVSRALKQNGIKIIDVRRRGKWAAILAQGRPKKV